MWARLHPPCLYRCQGSGAGPPGAPHVTAAATGWSFPPRPTYPMSHCSPSRHRDATPLQPSSCHNQSSTVLPIEPSPGRLASVVSRWPSRSVTPCCAHPRASRRSVPSSEPTSPSTCVDPNRNSSPSSSHLAGEALPSSPSQAWRSTAPGVAPRLKKKPFFRFCTCPSSNFENS
jgi:hypothetical protein